MSLPKSRKQLEAQLAQAQSLEKRGNLAGAVTLYRELAQVLPQNAPLLSTLGTLTLQLGDINEGVRLLGLSLNIDPNQPIALSNLGLGLKSLGNLESALECLNLALALKPDFFDAYNNRGLVLKDLNRLPEALESYEAAIAHHPKFAQAYNNRGIVLRDLAKLDQAIESFAKAIEVDLNFIEACTNLGSALREYGRADEALPFADRSIALAPDNPEAHNNRALVLRDLHRLDEALDSVDLAISLNPNYADALNNRGNILKDLGRWDDAFESFDRAIAINSNFAEAYYNRGIVLHGLRRFEEALSDSDRAVALAPESLDAHNNRGNLLKDLQHFSDAEAVYDRAIALNPEYASAHWNKALLKLLTGDFEEGWRLYEWRWKGPLKCAPRPFTQPLWLGDVPLAGKRLLVHAEQGLGDVIQFCRYIPLLEAQGAEVILEVPATLMRLLETLTGHPTLVAMGQPLPEFDLQCPIMSLPLAFKTTLDMVPAAVPYLGAEESKRQFWRDRLGERRCKRIGLVWSGSRDHANDHNRSIALSLLAPLLELPLEFHSLQKELRDADAAWLECNPRILQHQAYLQDFSDTAALIAEMDLVISVDTSVAHLAGALGKPVWVLLPYAPDFRWLLERSDSPWYPSATLFRQPTAGDWGAVVQQLKEMLTSTGLR